MFFMGVCRLLRKLVGSSWDVSVCFFMCVCVGCLGDGSVACGMCRCVFLLVCVGCWGDWSVACGMRRYVFMGVCVSVAWEIGR